MSSWLWQQQLAYGGSPRYGHDGWPRSAMVSFATVIVVPMLGEVLWVQWWQQHITSATCGVPWKRFVAALGISG